jgi:hypothetical protein
VTSGLANKKRELPKGKGQCYLKEPGLKISKFEENYETTDPRTLGIKKAMRKFTLRRIIFKMWKLMLKKISQAVIKKRQGMQGEKIKRKKDMHDS